MSVLEDRIDGAEGKDPGQQRPNGATGAVDAEGVERIVVAEARFYVRHHQVAEGPGKQADDQGGARADKSGSGRDSYESGNGAGDCSQSAWFLIAEPFCAAPAHDGCGCSQMRGDKGAGSKAACAERAAGIEAKPSNPEQTGSDKAQDHAVWWHGLMRIAHAPAQIKAANQRRDS